MTLRYYSYLFMLFFTLAGFVQAATPSQNKALETKIKQVAQSYLELYAEEEKFTAIQITVRKANDDPITIALGFTDLNKKEALSPEHLFQIGSIAKSFVAATVLKLCSNPTLGLSLNDKLSQYFPEYPQWSEITVRELLSMTSGIPDSLVQVDILATVGEQPYQYRPPDVWLTKVHALPLQFKPGTRFQYSNTNYILLGRLIEKITGKSLAQELSDAILIPLKLQKTQMVSHQLTDDDKKSLAKGYQNEHVLDAFSPQGTEVSDYSLSYLFAAGNMVANTEDVSRWIKILFTPDAFLSQQEFHDLTQLVSEKTGSPLNQVGMSEPYGYGLGIVAHYSPTLHAPIYLYEGITLGYRMVYVYVPQKKLIIVAAVNSSYISKENHLIALINQTASLIL